MLGKWPLWGKGTEEDLEVEAALAEVTFVGAVRSSPGSSM